MFDNLICPVSSEKIDSNVSRITVFTNVLLMLAFIATLNPIFILIVSVDYFIRAFLDLKFSPIRLIGISAVSILGLNKKPIDLAQKIFASRLGFLCAISSAILFFTGNLFASQIIAGFLMILSTLDSVFNLCVGCLIYNHMVFPFYKK